MCVQRSEDPLEMISRLMRDDPIEQVPRSVSSVMWITSSELTWDTILDFSFNPVGDTTRSRLVRQGLRSCVHDVHTRILRKIHVYYVRYT